MSGRTRTLWLAASLLAASTAAAPAAPIRPVLRNPLPFAPSEDLAYTATWSGMEAASARLRVEAGPKGSLRLVASGATTSLVKALYDASFEEVLECDARTLAPRSVRRTTRVGTETTVQEASFDPARGRVTGPQGPRPLAAGALDPLGLLYFLRAVKLGRLGVTFPLAVSDLGQPWQVTGELVDRQGGVATLRLTATNGDHQEYLLRLEEGGRRRLLELRTKLPVGEVVLTLSP